MAINSFLPAQFFNRDTQKVAQDLIGKVIYHKYKGIWLTAQIIETEAYYLHEKGSHASLGYTEKRKALFMKPGTVYMYYARGSDSLNVSCKGAGNAVLIKSGYPYVDDQTDPEMIKTMQGLNPFRGGAPRTVEKLCSGQTLLCKSLGLKVREWNQQQFDPDRFFIADVGYRPGKVIQTRRLGIPAKRDGHLMYRFIDYKFAAWCTSNPLKKQSHQEGEDYVLLRNE